MAQKLKNMQAQTFRISNQIRSAFENEHYNEADTIAKAETGHADNDDFMSELYNAHARMGVYQHCMNFVDVAVKNNVAEPDVPPTGAYTITPLQKQANNVINEIVNSVEAHQREIESNSKKDDMGAMTYNSRLEAVENAKNMITRIVAENTI